MQQTAVQSSVMTVEEIFDAKIPTFIVRRHNVQQTAVQSSAMTVTEIFDAKIP